jgi:hypothetical protein
MEAPSHLPGADPDSEHVPLGVGLRVESLRAPKAAGEKEAAVINGNLEPLEGNKGFLFETFGLRPGPMESRPVH